MKQKISNTLNITLAWAVPLRIDKAGAHVEAYIQTLPTTIALRLCRQFGTGPECYINKLPVELVTEIEKFIVEPAREKALEAWSRDYKCFELRCDIIDDHMTHESQHEMYHLDREPCPTTKQCSFNQEITPQTAAENRAKVLQCVFDSSGWWDPEHDKRYGAWELRVNLDLDDCVFTKHQALLRSHFGIDIWTSCVRMPPPKAVSDTSEKWKCKESQGTSIAYMTLPNARHTREDWATTKFDGDEFWSGYAATVDLGNKPSQASLQRFSRAMSILGLEVFIHPTQKGTVIFPRTNVESTDADAADPTDGSLARWPQLTLLTRCHTEAQ